MSRRKARNHAFAILFQLPYHEKFDAEKAYEYYIEDLVNLKDEDKEFIYHTLKGTIQNLEKIDELISINSKKWQIGRLDKEVLAIFRIAIYEMLFNEEVPNAVSVNEAVELSKIYCAEETWSYINGVLINISKSLEKEKLDNDK